MFYRITISREAEKDLDGIRAADPAAHAALLALLQEVKNDQYLLESLSIHDFGSDRWRDRFSVQQWLNQQRQDRNLWRLKMWDMENRGLRYRLVYAFDPRITCYHVLAVLERDQLDYDNPADPIIRRILAAYDRLGIPAYRGTH